ncbi:hypothetical protein BV97_03562 [Novosphingobium resinovorum]|uniref:Uncharacterized protein n=1 Tax=Novosphingobium resinovorum TaxID=158500 RepID=A0A031JTL7_9SPHN|nr:hypothetical protein [Novosphingobium resinovorum]EZP80148.1 hypothetical protein BV97_03562 [Novosphingobium resinovorum]
MPRFRFFVPALLLCAAPAFAANTEPRKAVELPPPDPTFLPMEQIDAPIVDGGRVDGVLHVAITLQAKTADDAAALAKRMPELRAAALPATIEFARLRASRFSPVDVERLAGMIAPSVKRVDPAIDKVLIVKVSATER